MTALNFAWNQTTAGGIGYPNLAKHSAQPFTPSWREFDHHWPRVVPLRLLMYLEHAGVKYANHDIATAPVGSWYPVAWSWFDFAIDYIELIDVHVLERIRKKDLRVLFYYHEGDDPKKICDRLDLLAALHGLPENCYLLISSNSSACHYPRAVYFDDHECFFRYVNRHQPYISSDVLPDQDFTLLSRTHKWWRCSIVTDLWRTGCLANSHWSYNTKLSVEESPDDNPISVDMISDLRSDMDKFLSGGPYKCDDLDPAAQNDHHHVNQNLYQRSFIHLVLETHFDADQSGGTFLTEKTYKCIKFCQPFIIIGSQGSLAVLRSHGYRVFDDILDNSYDTIEDATQRWVALRSTIKQIQRDGPEKIWTQCQPDVRHNHDWFHQRTVASVMNIIKEIQCRQ